MKVGGIPPSRKEAREYEKALREGWLNPFFMSIREALAEFDMAEMSSNEYLRIVGAAVAGHQMLMKVRFPRKIVEQWATRVTADHSHKFIKQFARAKVDIRPVMKDANINMALQQAVHENIDLITKLEQAAKDRLEERFLTAERKAPLDQAARERLFRNQIGVTGHRLRLITRDQSNKLYGRLSEIRQTDAGISRYRWSTSNDDRVRTTHMEKQGKVFLWSSAPQDTGHPGHDIQCRCVAIPDISLEELQARFG